MNKKLKYLLISTTIAIGAITTPIIISNLASCSCLYHPDKPKLNVLSSQIVNNNFKSNGIWANKKFISSQDLQLYDAISINAFDQISNQLDYIELDNNKKITNDDNTPIIYKDNPFIKWDNINEIRIINKNEDDKNKTLISYSGLIYYKINTQSYTPITLTNKTQQIDLVFPGQYDIEFNEASITIPMDFYQKFNYKNTIKSISFYSRSNQDGSLIDMIDVNAFKDCNVLKPDLILNNSNKYKNLYIYDSAFQNSNLNILATNGYPFVYISKNAFTNSVNLSDAFIANSSIIKIDTNAFVNCSQKFSFSFVPLYNSSISLLELESNVFSNDKKYINFNFNFMVSKVQENAWSFVFKQDSLSSINLVDSNNFNFNIHCMLNESNQPLSDFDSILNYFKQEFSKSGLKQQYLDKMKPIPYDPTISMTKYFS